MVDIALCQLYPKVFFINHNSSARRLCSIMELTMEQEQFAEWHFYNMTEPPELPLYQYLFQERIANFL